MARRGAVYEVFKLQFINYPKHGRFSTIHIVLTLLKMQPLKSELILQMLIVFPFFFPDVAVT